MSCLTVHESIMGLERPIFTTKEIASMTGRSVSSVSTTLKLLETKGIIVRMSNGLWANPKDHRFNVFSAVHFLLNGHQVYISFITALHIHEMISQIPKVIYAASTSHTKIVKTPLATYSFHKISSPFFAGFDWYKGKGDFLIALKEKALVDSLYISTRKGRKFGHFPELDLPGDFSFRKCREWADLIPSKRIRSNVLGKLEEIYKGSRSRS